MARRSRQEIGTLLKSCHFTDHREYLIKSLLLLFPAFPFSLWNTGTTHRIFYSDCTNNGQPQGVAPT